MRKDEKLNTFVPARGPLALAAVLLAFGTVFAGVPVRVLAQGSISRSPAPSAAGKFVVRFGTCASMAASPSSLASTPEGRSMVMLKKELDVASKKAAERHGERSVEVRKIDSVQKGVDSLIQVIIRQSGDKDGRTTIVIRGDTAGRVEFDNRAARGEMEMRIRELQPKVAAIAASIDEHSFQHAATGWIGLRISGNFVRESGPNGIVTQYCDDYPVIEAVDPGSPSEKAGIQAGDTLIAFNGRDVLKNPTIHSKVFVAGQELKVQVQRTGKKRDFSLVVAEPRPSNRFEFRVPMMLPCTPGKCEAISLDSLFNLRRLMPDGKVFEFRSRDVPRGLERGDMQTPSLGMFLRDPGASVVGGAQVAVVNEELAQSLGLEQGLLVVRVLNGTPMADAGIKAGDVIRQVNGAPARDAVALQLAFSSATREARLSVITRGQAARAVTVKW